MGRKLWVLMGVLMVVMLWAARKPQSAAAYPGDNPGFTQYEANPEHDPYGPGKKGLDTDTAELSVIKEAPPIVKPVQKLSKLTIEGRKARITLDADAGGIWLYDKENEGLICIYGGYESAYPYIGVYSEVGGGAMPIAITVNSKREMLLQTRDPNGGRVKLLNVTELLQLESKFKELKARVDALEKGEPTPAEPPIPGLPPGGIYDDDHGVGYQLAPPAPQLYGSGD